MTIKDPREDRTELRLKLYDNGFTPLPNKTKMCLLPEWSKTKITPEVIKSKHWARKRGWSDTGVRCGDVIAVDWDVNNEELLNDLMDAVVAKGILVESPYVRIGKAPRELWVFKTADKISRMSTGAFMHDGNSTYGEHEEEEKVEVLGAGCQFAAFGMRDENTPYTWPVKDLTEVEYKNLPEITHSQVEELQIFASEFFEEKGLDRYSPMASTDGDYIRQYDLTPDMVFNVKDFGDMSVDDMAEYLATDQGRTLRCMVDALRPTSGSWAGMVSLVHGEVCLSDHGTYTAHFPEALSGNANTEKLGALLRERIQQQEKVTAEVQEQKVEKAKVDPMDPRDDLDTNLLRALQRFVFIKNDGLVCDISSGFLTHTMANFRNAMAPYYMVKEGPRGGEIMVSLADLWVRHADRVEVDTMQMRPEMSRPLFDDMGLQLNTYEPVEHEQLGGDASVGFDMLRRLIPFEEEFTYFKQWLAHKIRYPYIPGPAIIMVASDSYGTGRGSLISLMSSIFGHKYVGRINFDTLTGKGSQAQYNEWMVDNLVVAVDEAQEINKTQSKWQSRYNAYEHLKTVIDPASREIDIKRKTVKNGKAWTYASVFVATNHGDAFIVPEKDRRLFVIENGKPLPEHYWTSFHEWRRDPGNIAAFVQELRRVDLGKYNPYTAPPMTRAKADMIDAGSSSIDRAMKYVLPKLTGALLTREQLRLHLEDAIRDLGGDYPDDYTKVVEALYRKNTRKIIHTDVIRVGEITYPVRSLPDHVISSKMTREEMLYELEKNGPFAREGREAAGGKVVAFKQRN